MKKLTFTVTLGFSGKITDDKQIKTIAENIAKAIIHEAGTAGIIPDDCDEFTESIRVQSDILGVDVKIKR
jgi:hypothetical protein